MFCYSTRVLPQHLCTQHTHTHRHYIHTSHLACTNITPVSHTQIYITHVDTQVSPITLRDSPQACEKNIANPPCLAPARQPPSGWSWSRVNLITGSAWCTAQPQPGWEHIKTSRSCEGRKPEERAIFRSQVGLLQAWWLRGEGVNCGMEAEVRAQANLKEICWN